MQGLNSVVKAARKNSDYDIAVVMKDKYLSIATLLKNTSKVKNYTLAVKKSVVNPEFFEDLKNIKINETNSFQITDKYFVISKPIKDFSGNIVGYALIGNKIKNVNSIITQSKNSLLQQMYIMSFIDLFMLIFLLIIIKKSVTDPIVNLDKVAAELALGNADLSKRLPIHLLKHLHSSLKTVKSLQEIMKILVMVSLQIWQNLIIWSIKTMPTLQC